MKRDIVGFMTPSPEPCPMCKTMTDVFEKVIVDGKVRLICSECMDRVLEEIQKEIMEREGDPDD